MNIKIKNTNGDVFDLPSDYTIEVEVNSPVFEQKGSQTVPINFPATKRNNRLLNFPTRLDRFNRMDETIPVIVESGPVQQRGALSIGSAGDGVISANIGLDESEMYARMKQMQLRDIPNLPVIDQGGSTLLQQIDSILTHLNAVMKEQKQADYVVFPLVVKIYKVESDIGSVHLYEILNKINAGDENTNVAPGELLALEDRVIIRSENDEQINISCPKGYGVTAFLKVGVILNLIFNQYGYTVEENPFKTHRQLKKLVVLNNTIDAILSGKLYYKDMMPDVTIQEFLESLYTKFGMVYFVDSTKRTVKIKFLKDILDRSPAGIRDLTRKLTSEPSITYSGPKQLRLKATRASLEDKKQSADVLYDTYEEILQKFGYHESSVFLFNDRYSRYSITNIFQFNADDADNPMVQYSSDFFDWDKKTENVEYEEIKQKDLCLPFSKYSELLLLTYPVDFKQVYTDIVIAGEKQEGVVNPAKLAFVFYFGLQNQGTPSNPKYYPFASQINRDVNGEFMFDEAGNKYDISMTNNQQDGLFNRFWKEYDAFIRHSNQEVSCKMHLSEIEIRTLKIYERISIKNQLFAIQKIKYSQNGKNKDTELTLRTLRLYNADNLENEQRIPQINPIGLFYYWEKTESEDFNITQDENYQYGISSIENTYDKYYEINGVKIPITSVSYYPPTESQYNAHETRIYHITRKYTFRNYIPIIHRHPTRTVNITVTFVAKNNIIQP
jgi:hypothetical protein